jgi:hypothetical protein
MKQDRFLLVILAATGLLIILAVALFFIRQNTQTYGPEDSPEGVLRNYLLAINRKDFSRAYEYLLDTETKPDFEQFQINLKRKTDLINRTALKIVSIDLAENEAEIKVIVSREGADLFESRYTSQRTVVSVFQDGVWKLTSVPYPFGY